MDMTNDSEASGRIAIVSRRFLMVSVASALLVKPLLAIADDASTTAPEQTEQFKEAYARLVGAATPATEHITVELPEIAENGNFVPYTVSVESPMTDQDYIKTIHIVSSGNPVALIASFHLSPLNGRARVQSRIRLARTQDVITLAEKSDGSLLMATSRVMVTIGGCAG